MGSHQQSWWFTDGNQPLGISPRFVAGTGRERGPGLDSGSPVFLKS